MTSFSAALAVEPVPKGRPRFGQGRVYTPERTAQFETTIRWLLRQQKAPLLKGDLGADITFWLTRQDGDVDNYLKACLDASQGILFGNDRQVKDVHCRLMKVTAGVMPCIELAIWETELFRISHGRARAAGVQVRDNGGRMAAVLAAPVGGARRDGGSRDVRGLWRVCGLLATRRHSAPPYGRARRTCKWTSSRSVTACRRRTRPGPSARRRPGT
jgi:Holliday junction resolvase RusA-like endonuclease